MDIMEIKARAVDILNMKGFDEFEVREVSWSADWTNGYNIRFNAYDGDQFEGQTISEPTISECFQRLSEIPGRERRDLNRLARELKFLQERGVEQLRLVLESRVNADE